MFGKKDGETGGKILSLGEARPPRAQPAVERIERYWNHVRGTRLVPSRCEIDPRGLEGILGHAFILERITGGLARFRIAGSHLTELTGLELRQMPLSALFLPDSREILSEAMEAAFDEPAIVRMRIESPGGFGRERLEGAMTLLPLRSDLGDIDRMLGGLQLEGKIGRTPRRFSITGQKRQSLIGYAGPAHLDTRLPDRVPPAATARPARPVPPAPVPPAPRPARPVSERPYLRLVVENDA